MKLAATASCWHTVLYQPHACVPEPLWATSVPQSEVELHSQSSFLALLWGLSTIPQLEAAMSTMIGIAPRLYSNVVFWLTVGLAAPVIALMSDFLRVAFERQFCPQDHQIFQASRGLGS